MNGYIKILVTPGDIVCWQQIENGIVIDYVDATDTHIDLPDPCESNVTDRTLCELPGTN